MRSHIFSNTRIALIGAGNMGAALLGGLVQNGFTAQNIFISDRDQDKLNQLQQKYLIHITTNNKIAIAEADIILFAVKPQQFEGVVKQLTELIQKKRPLIISIAAGIRSQRIAEWLGGSLAIVRCMPNTPALIGAGITGLFANADVTLEQRNQAESILRAVGEIIWLNDEKLIDAVTALSGSGPAYFFLILDAMQQAGQKLGLTANTAFLLTIQTALGAARMALQQQASLAELRQRVTSPGGTTEAALQVLERGKLFDLFQQAILAAEQRAHELGV